MEEKDLLLLLLKKDERAFDTLYDMYSRNLYGVIYNILNTKEEAEDVLQEVFIKIWANITTYNASKGRLFTWLINIARNAAIDKYRSKNFNNSKENLSTDNFVHILEASAKETNRLDTIGLQNILKQLKPSCIKIIDLLFFKGFTQKETAEELNIPLGTVKTRNRNCLTHLRQNLGNG